jgi:CheY-like chemotaxis protein
LCSAGDGNNQSDHRPEESRATAVRRILVVEDESLIASFLVELLDDLHYEVAGPATSAANALRVAEQTRPHLALVDIGLTGRTDGVAVAVDLRKRFDVPTIFLSGTADPTVIERAKSADPVTFIHKPFAVEEIEAALKEAFAAD